MLNERWQYRIKDHFWSLKLSIHTIKKHKLYVHFVLTFSIELNNEPTFTKHSPLLSSLLSWWSGSICRTRAPRPWWWMSGRRSGRCWTACWISPTVATALTGLLWKPSLSFRWVREQPQIFSTTLESNKWFALVCTDCTWVINTSTELPGGRKVLLFIPSSSLCLSQSVFLRITRIWWRTYWTGPGTATTSSCSSNASRNTLFSRTLRWLSITLQHTHTHTGERGRIIFLITFVAALYSAYKCWKHMLYTQTHCLCMLSGCTAQRVNKAVCLCRRVGSRSKL